MRIDFHGLVKFYCNKKTMRIEAQEIPPRGSFRYLGSIISKDGEIYEDVE